MPFQLSLLLLSKYKIHHFSQWIDENRWKDKLVGQSSIFIVCFVAPVKASRCALFHPALIVSSMETQSKFKEQHCHTLGRALLMKNHKTNECRNEMSRVLFLDYFIFFFSFLFASPEFSQHFHLALHHHFVCWFLFCLSLNKFAATAMATAFICSNCHDNSSAVRTVKLYHRIIYHKCNDNEFWR